MVDGGNSPPLWHRSTACHCKEQLRLPSVSRLLAVVPSFSSCTLITRAEFSCCGYEGSGEARFGSSVKKGGRVLALRSLPVLASSTHALNSLLCTKQS
jgi:hypothetical protein